MARSMLPAVTSFLICAKNSFEFTLYFESWNATRSTIIATTTALTTRLATRNVGFSLKAFIRPELPLAACAACSATRTTNIPRRSFLTLSIHGKPDPAVSLGRRGDEKLQGLQR